MTGKNERQLLDDTARSASKAESGECAAHGEANGQCKKAGLSANAAALAENLRRASESEEVVDLGILFIGYSLDVVGAFCFGRDLGAQEDLGLRGSGTPLGGVWRGLRRS